MFDLVASGVGKELSGDYSNQIAMRGGFNPNSDMNLAFFYEDTREVYYLGYMDSILIDIYQPDINLYLNNRISPIRSSSEIKVECSLWQTKDAVKNVRTVIDKYFIDFSESFNSPKNYLGTLIGYIDLINGDQFRFLLPGFLFTEYEHKFSFGSSTDLIRTELRGKPTHYLPSNNSWNLIEEQKKIDYAKVRTIEHL